MIFDTIVVGPLQVNCYLVGCDTSREIFIIDPGDEPERILQAVASHDYKAVGIINTHCHLDHAGAVRDIQKTLKIPFYIHEDERPVLEILPEQQQQFGLYFSGMPEHVDMVTDGSKLVAGSITLTVIHTPGHSPGGICLYGNDMLLSGDTLFAGSIGRTDLPGGDFQQIMQSIRDKILRLPGKTRIFPGHGPPTSLARERRFNPFLQDIPGA